MSSFSCSQVAAAAAGDASPAGAELADADEAVASLFSAEYTHDWQADMVLVPLNSMHELTWNLSSSQLAISVASAGARNGPRQTRLTMITNAFRGNEWVVMSACFATGREV
jgi:hypothetical protein